MVRPIGLVVSGRPKRRMKEVPPVPQGMRSRSGTSDHVGVNWQLPGGVRLQIAGLSVRIMG